jgi:hypothetical protein
VVTLAAIGTGTASGAARQPLYVGQFAMKDRESRAVRLLRAAITTWESRRDRRSSAARPGIHALTAQSTTLANISPMPSQ